MALIREIDGILANEHHYILEWDAPFQRMAYWNKFGQPEATSLASATTATSLSLWWFDPQKDAQLARAMRDPSVKLEVGETEIRYWQEYARSSRRATAPTDQPASR